MIRAAITKDVWLLVRDRGALVSLFLMPVIFMVAFGAMFKFGVDRDEPRPIAVWRATADPRGEAIVQALAHAPGFVAVPMDTPDAARRAVGAETATAAIVVPDEPGTPVELVLDRSAPIQVRGPLEGALTAVITGALAPATPAPPALVVTSAPGTEAPPETPSSFQVTVPGNAVLFGFFLALTVAMAFAGERRTGTWRRLLAAPVPRWRALIATLVPYYLVGLVQLAFLFGIGILGFGMEVAGSVAGLIVLSMALVYCAVALGLLFAAVGGSEKQLGGIGSVVLLVMGMLGGCMVPRLVMPPFMQRLGLAVPHGWALDGYEAVLVRPGTTLIDLAPSIAGLVAFGTGFAIAGVALFRFER